MGLPEQTEMLIPLAEERFVVFAVETSMLNAQGKLIGIACLEIIGGKIRNEFHTPVQPTQPFDETEQAEFGFRDSDYAEFPRLETVAASLLPFLHGAIVVAHGVTYDLHHLTKHDALKGISGLRSIDNADLVQRFLPRPRMLEVVAKRLGFHDPLMDTCIRTNCRVKARVFMHLVEHSSASNSAVTFHDLKRLALASPEDLEQLLHQRGFERQEDRWSERAVEGVRQALLPKIKADASRLSDLETFANSIAIEVDFPV